MILLLGVAFAFSAADWFGASVHDRITRRAEASLVDAGYRRFAKPERSLHKVLQLQDGLDLAVAAERIQLASLLFPDLRPAIAEKVRDVVPSSLYRPEHHFFREGRHSVGLGRSSDAFEAGAERYQRHLARAVRRAREGAFGCAVIDIGVALHTVQDFYAHSNVAELSGRLAPFADVDGAATLAEVDRCLSPASANCDAASTQGTLLLTYFPNFEPARLGDGDVGPEPGAYPGGVDCPDDEACYGRLMRSAEWAKAVEASCANLLLRAPRPTEETYAHVCFSKEVRYPRVKPTVPEAWPEAWRTANELATARTATTLRWLSDELSQEPVPLGARCDEADLWACVTTADRRQCRL